MKTGKAKQIIKAKLDELKLSYVKLTAKTIDFMDLARDGCVFVKIHGWRSNPQWGILDKTAKENGFRIE